MAAHPDVEAAYGVMNFSGAISHFYEWGKPGGWYGSEWITDSSAFQLGYYLANNADVRAVTNNPNQEVEATRHWYFVGIYEGRRGSPEFDAKFYLAKYEDVRAAFGANNYRGALDHYLLFGKAGGRIGADDTPRSLSINDVSVIEGNSGSQYLVFTVSLNIVTGETVTVSYSTADGTATSGSASTDYRGISGSLSFAPCETSKTIRIEIFGDTTFESDETFVVSLSNSTYASIDKGQGTGTILNDDPQIINDGKSSFSIAGNPVVGKTLTATKIADDPDGNGTFTCVWQSSSDGNSWSTIGSNAASLLLGFSEAGKQVRATISHTDSEGFAESVSVVPLAIGRGVVTAAITGISDNVGLIQGTVTPGGATDDPTPTITGRFSAPLVSGESIRIFNGTVLLGNAVVNNTTGTWSFTPTITGTITAALAAGETLRIFNGATLLGTAAVNNLAKTWSFTPTLPATPGTTYSITARVADPAGNLGTSSAPPRRFFLDSIAPATTAAITGVTDNAGLIRGPVAPGARTDDTTPTITGTISSALVAGETLRIFNGATLLGTAAVNNLAKTWSFTPTLPATAGTTYSITARVADATGNLGPASVARSFVPDTTAPSVASFSPLDGAIGVDPAANILLTFSETIQRGTGTIQLRVGLAAGPITESFDAATSTRLSASAAAASRSTPPATWRPTPATSSACRPGPSSIRRATRSLAAAPATSSAPMSFPAAPPTTSFPSPPPLTASRAWPVAIHFASPPSAIPYSPPVRQPPSIGSRIWSQASMPSMRRWCATWPRR
nr:Calx-beta domain-containing protein [Cyanobium sp. Cruz CV11-17]